MFFSKRQMAFFGIRHQLNTKMACLDELKMPFCTTNYALFFCKRAAFIRVL